MVLLLKGTMLKFHLVASAHSTTLCQFIRTGDGEMHACPEDANGNLPSCPGGAVGVGKFCAAVSRTRATAPVCKLSVWSRRHMWETELWNADRVLVVLL